MTSLLPHQSASARFAASPLAEAAYAKVFRRVVWYVFVLYICAYLDRINIGFAALVMNRDLGLTPTTFGIANTVFYVGYMAFEVPSNLLLARYGARRWLARIMVTGRGLDSDGIRYR